MTIGLIRKIIPKYPINWHFSPVTGINQSFVSVTQNANHAHVSLKVVFQLGKGENFAHHLLIFQVPLHHNLEKIILISLN